MCGIYAIPLQNALLGYKNEDKQNYLKKQYLEDDIKQLITPEFIKSLFFRMIYYFV